jgi:MYXO-CTERM domain-containing protein
MHLYHLTPLVALLLPCLPADARAHAVGTDPAGDARSREETGSSLVPRPAHGTTARALPTAAGPNQVWEHESNIAGAKLGAALSGAGDVNGDGFDDLLVGAPGFADGQTGEGQVQLFLGSASGFAADQPPDWTYAADQEYAELGSAVASAGDVNGDGYDDLLVGVPYGSSDPTDSSQASEGLVLLFLGSATGPAGVPDRVIDLNQKGAHLGAAVAGVGDVNGDTYDDVLVGAPSWHGSSSTSDVNEGGAWLYLGGVEGLSAEPAWHAEGEQSGAFFGCAVGGGGDVGGDSLPDLIVGACLYDNKGSTTIKDVGLVQVFFGSETAIAAAPDWYMLGAKVGDGFGNSLTVAYDVDGDARDDLLVGASAYDDTYANEGAALLFKGPLAALEEAAWRSTSGQKDGNWGQNVVSVRDLNGDGFGDVLVSTAFYDTSPSLLNVGRVALYYGSSTGLATSPAWTADGLQANENFGYSIASVGDVDGNGCLEFAVGVSNFGHDEAGEGDVLVFEGNGEDKDGDGRCGGGGASSDCNDDDPSIYPGATEIAGDGIDQSCDGKDLCYIDADKDGFRSSTHETAGSDDLTCPTSAGLAPASAPDTDCDDTDAAVNPDAVEVCNLADDNCNGETDEGVSTTYYQDGDGDQYGNPDKTRQDCQKPQGYVEDHSDCDDTKANIYPGAPELPADGIDEDCDGSEDCYVDADGDGYRPSEEAVTPSPDLTCDGEGEAEASIPTGDCKDEDATINPAALETCNAVDDNCDDEIDNGTAVDCPTGDFDGDGYNESQGDCNDQGATVYPGAAEHCDGVDEDCNGDIDDDTCASPTPSDDGGDGCSCRTGEGSSRPMAGWAGWAAVVAGALLRRRSGSSRLRR